MSPSPVPLFAHKNFWKYYPLCESFCSRRLLKARVFLNFTPCWIFQFTAVLKDRTVFSSASSCPLLRHFVGIMRNALVHWISKVHLFILNLVVRILQVFLCVRSPRFVFIIHLLSCLILSHFAWVLCLIRYIGLYPRSLQYNF